MVMLLFVRYRENNLYIRIEALQSISFEVGRGFEVDTIRAWLEGLGGGQQMFAAAIRIGNRTNRGTLYHDVDTRYRIFIFSGS